MRTKLGPKESFTLYGIFLGLLFLFFVVGMLVGKGHLVEPTPVTQRIPFSRPPVEDVKPDLEFYQSLMQPSNVRKEQGPNETESTLLVEAPASQVKSSRQDEKEDSLRKLYTVQVGALTAEEDARRILIRLEAKGYSGTLRTPSGEDRYYRVWVGEFQGAEEARHLEKRLRKDGFLTYLKKTY